MVLCVREPGPPAGPGRVHGVGAGCWQGPPLLSPRGYMSRRLNRSAPMPSSTAV